MNKKTQCVSSSSHSSSQSRSHPSSSSSSSSVKEMEKRRNGKKRLRRSDPDSSSEDEDDYEDDEPLQYLDDDEDDDDDQEEDESDDPEYVDWDEQLQLAKIDIWQCSPMVLIKYYKNLKWISKDFKASQLPKTEMRSNSQLTSSMDDPTSISSVSTGVNTSSGPTQTTTTFTAFEIFTPLN